jgi:triacylglycerol esterase/lipase EstA (alpha/beta hydrolase family)
MDPLCRYLREKGGYQVFNVSYPSTREDIAEHARSLRHVVNSLDGIKEINFVGHSLGNIVIRHYLGDLARQQSWKQSANAAAADRRAKARFHRFVMLTPPNQGALLADKFADNLIFQEIIGQSGQQLGRD